ncbi:integrase [Psychromonas sp. PRT-SC03]|nr:integrase [Psychromonas sp. PRT-SC03]
MIIINSTSDYKIKGHPFPDFPLLTGSKSNVNLNIETGMLFEEGLEFLKYYLIKRGRVMSKKSWNTYAKHLVSFFTFCEDNEQEWRNIADDGENEMLLAVYRDVCIEDYGILVNSTNQHLRTIIQFYRYAVGQGWVESLPYSLESIKANRNKHSFLAHTVTNGGKSYSPDIMMKTHEKPPKFLQTEEVQILIKSINNPILKLMVRLCLQTGIRKKELLLFPLDAIRKTRPSEKVCKVDITRTKGEKVRSIDLPVRLMNDLWGYVNELRFQQQQESGIQSEYLFLTSEGQEWQVEGNGFNKALNDLGLPFKVNPHKLRHTYATHMLKGLQEKRSTKFEPLMYLQNRLGHSSIITTMKYLHLVNDLMDDLSIEYQDSINAIEAT